MLEIKAPHMTLTTAALVVLGIAAILYLLRKRRTKAGQ